MSTAKTGNRILDQINRAGEARARQNEAASKKAEGEKKKAVARARAAGRAGRAGTSRGSARRAAGGKRGRGISIQSQKNGRGFKGILDYSLDPDKNPQIVSTNCGPNPLQTMCHAAALRPDINHPVGHITLSLPPSVGKDDRWAAMVDEARAKLGLNDSFPYQVVHHGDRPHDHVHLIFSRVSIDGRVHDQRNLGLRCAAVEKAIEAQFGLKLFPRGAANVSKNEIEMGLRTGQLPARLEIQRALDAALADSPTVPVLVERLAIAGITAIPNISPTTKKMSGFSFEFAGVRFKGSQLGKDYGWKSLQERLDHEQTSAAKAAPKRGHQAGQASPVTPTANAISSASPSHPSGRALGGEDARVGVPGPSNSLSPNPNSNLEKPTFGVSAGAAPTNDNERNTKMNTNTVANAVPLRAFQRRGSQCPHGFELVEDLGSRGGPWTEGLSNQLLPAAPHGHVNAFKYPAYFTQEGQSMAAVGRADGGIGIPIPHKLTDGQLIELMLESNCAEVRGNQDFCERVEKLADRLCRKVTHPFQSAPGAKTDPSESEDPTEPDFSNVNGRGMECK